MTKGIDAAKSAMHYVAPVGEMDDYVVRAMRNIGPFLEGTLVSVISQFDGPMIKVGDGCRAIETLEMAQKTAWQKEVWRLICHRAQIVPRRPL